MQATGIVRRIDELGRIVIPKEIRRSMRIREGDALEIFCDKSENSICLRRYSPLGTFKEEFASTLNSFAKKYKCNYCLLDCDSIIESSIPAIKGHDISLETSDWVRNKCIDCIPQSFCSGLRLSFKDGSAFPIVLDGEAVGALVFAHAPYRAEGFTATAEFLALHFAHEIGESM